jgi:hypothetical protein
MRYSVSTAWLPPAQAEAQYDMTLDDESDKQIDDTIKEEPTIEWPTKTNGGRTLRRVLSGNPERRPSDFQTNS